MLKGKKVVLGVTGSIAAYKMANVASMLKKLHCDVHVILTESGAEFITPITFETLTKNPCLMDDFSRNNPKEIAHITLGQTADLLMVAPASANSIAKMANGIADDLLSSTIVAATCPVLIAPAMNTHMYTNPIVQENMKRLKSFGYTFIEPATGHLACDVDGIGKLPEEQVLVDAIVRKILENEVVSQDLAGCHILVTAGPTRESLDPVRFITNHSSGKMGYAIAEQAAKRGAEVTLVSGPVNLNVPEGVNVVPITTAEDMYQAVVSRAVKQDIIIKAAAVADYRPKQVNTEKTKKKDGDMVIELERTKDILAQLGSQKTENQCICGFSMETENVMENSRQKLTKKNVDMIAANSIRESGAGFGVDTNHLVLITKDGEYDLGMLTKEACADALLDHVLKIWESKQK
ncbi:MAG: bifunctional phosphopantothenoylcysteine decarboxylase/phosphopantothenate--cysteine ligase CoaBC [Lachnospiraceae bacterium]|nr:bifunctional phosphopantothenoylcysteine decarboxylase/phosphopantothenate--cysteine ligase CoaBC [Lachnospiraceae bacterium]